MNIREVQDRLIGAESVMRELSEARVGPAPLRAQQLPYAHSEDDMRNWGHRRGEKRSLNKKADACRLTKEDEDGHSIYRREFWEQFKEPPSPGEISHAHSVLDWATLVDDEGERRALRAWTYAMAGGRPFARWCRLIEKVSPMTGRRRKNRAITQIIAKLGGKPDLHDEIAGKGVLPVAPGIGDIFDTLTAPVSGRETGLNSWASDEAFQPIRVVNAPGQRTSVDTSQDDFSWARKRNAQRRQREAAKRKQARAA